MRKRIILGLVLVQLGLVGALGFSIYQKYQTSQKVLSITVLNKNDLSFIKDSSLKYFYEPKPDQEYQPASNGLAELLKYHINSDTLRETRDYTETKPNQTFRILTLGDSFAFGLGVPDGTTWSDKLETALNSISCAGTKFEVINLGFPGYDIQYEVERMKRRGVKYHADLLIWLVKQNDFDNINEFLIPTRENIQQSMSNAEKESYFKQGNFYPWTLKALGEFRKVYPPDKITAYQRGALNSVSDYFKGKIIFFDFKSDLSNSWRGVVNEFVKSHYEAYFLDGLEGEVMNTSSRLTDGHPNEKGHALISQALKDYLSSKSLISCR